MKRSGYCPQTPAQIREMLAVIGVSSIAELFAVIPPELRARSFEVPEGISEFEMLAGMEALAGQDRRDIIPFIGGGSYDHLIPAVVDHLAGRAEFATSYTPYQPECAQGTLQALYEYQTVICRLTGMNATNASLYDGGSALAEAALMALRITGRKKILVDAAVNPFSRQIVQTCLANLAVEVVEIAAIKGQSDRQQFLATLDNETAAIILQNPNFFGGVDDFSDLAAAARGRGALTVVSVYPLSLGLLKTPGEMGADLAVGDGQSLGNPLTFGGPSFGFLAVKKEHIRNLPGRIVGETVDKEGRRGFVLTLQAREQHIRRQKATSNICSNQSLSALRGLIFLSTLGREGFVELARLNYDKAQYAKGLLAGIRGISLLNEGPTFNEFSLCLPTDAAGVCAQLLTRGIAAGVPLGRWYPGLEACLTVTVTEKRSRAEIENLAAELEEVLWS
ncbi:MAG: aminomethyl-transferring glycine dehydrogenase subunit GcvPA [Deltaproteobacteria bacterium]|nr:aminomethyl-transferring glycine dehydrogenase subunit GcvPA [Deltaproteobacteria bacterium]TLN02705.1 MAG: aminomethyl-transferring glycine dehydrogenase subunit GcvPA [bacterium]